MWNETYSTRIVSNVQCIALLYKNTMAYITRRRSTSPHTHTMLLHLICLNIIWLLYNTQQKKRSTDWWLAICIVRSKMRTVGITKNTHTHEIHLSNAHSSIHTQYTATEWLDLPSSWRVIQLNEFQSVDDWLKSSNSRSRRDLILLYHLKWTNSPPLQRFRRWQFERLNPIWVEDKNVVMIEKSIEKKILF